jgi:hypothetical protein
LNQTFRFAQRRLLNDSIPSRIGADKKPLSSAPIRDIRG